MRPPHHLMPIPAILRLRPGSLALDNSFTVAAQGYTDARLRDAMKRAVKRLSARTGIKFASGIATSETKATLIIHCQSSGHRIPALEEDESYQLEVNQHGARLTAATVVGALRGLETFLQLVEADAGGYYLPNVKIEDRPRFRWRGLLIDAARHFQPVEVIKRQLDGMAAVKLNVLHWHLTDNQGFRIESRRYPKLHERGSDGFYYKQTEVKEIVDYARMRGIRVVPEFDMPGHTTAWFVGYPELASRAGEYRIEREFGIFDPVMDVTREETYGFLDNFLGEMARLFPDEYIHIGGDEVNGREWRENRRIQAFIEQHGLKGSHGLQAYFNCRIEAICRKHGKRMIGWDEVLHPDLPQTTIIQSWRGEQSLAEAVKRGYSAILSSGYYLDLMLTAEDHYAVDPFPADERLTDDERARILGGEACMWSEYVDAETIDSRIWPRLAAIAERFWSPKNIRSAPDMYRRLKRVSRQLEELGLQHETCQARMLRRAAESERIAPLEMLIGLVTPVKFYERGELQPAPQLSPLTNLVDVARPDTEQAREFALMVESFLADAPDFQTNRRELSSAFGAWRNVHSTLQKLIARSRLWREVAPLARELAALGAAGLEAIEYLSKNIAPPDEWRAAQLALLERAAEPKAAVEFAFLPAFRELVMAAAQLPQLKTMTPKAWKKNVARLAEKMEAN